MTYYKVISVNPSTRVRQSALGLYISQEWRAVYTPNEWTIGLVNPGTYAPFNSGLFVFDNIKDAQKFVPASSLLDLEIWECECRDPVETPEALPGIGGFQTLNHDAFQTFWIKGTCDPDRSGPVPPGTKIFCQVKLTKQIPLEKKDD